MDFYKHYNKRIIRKDSKMNVWRGLQFWPNIDKHGEDLCSYPNLRCHSSLNSLPIWTRPGSMSLHFQYLSKRIYFKSLNLWKDCTNTQILFILLSLLLFAHSSLELPSSSTPEIISAAFLILGNNGVFTYDPSPILALNVFNDMLCCMKLTWRWPTENAHSASTDDACSDTRSVNSAQAK